uniref:Uncharacterized protein n=1 Tax=Anguilla anguilla TaxID=7936 RepID=A0A0E9UH67_ANGAN
MAVISNTSRWRASV